MQGDDLEALLFDVHFHFIDLVIEVNDFFGHSDIAILQGLLDLVRPAARRAPPAKESSS
jgi:NAD/NADP transhydrogenase beta subunit